jgi:hypothetical protein
VASRGYVGVVAHGDIGRGIVVVWNVWAHGDIGTLGSGLGLYGARFMASLGVGSW